MHIVKTWCEKTAEGEAYLNFCGYEQAKRIGATSFYICKKIGQKLRDVKVIF